MSRDQWHPQPTVRALVRLWTNLLAAWWGACWCSLDPQGSENMDNLDHVPPLLLYSSILHLDASVTSNQPTSTSTHLLPRRWSSAVSPSLHLSVLEKVHSNPENAQRDVFSVQSDYAPADKSTAVMIMSVISMISAAQGNQKKKSFWVMKQLLRTSFEKFHSPRLCLHVCSRKIFTEPWMTSAVLPHHRATNGQYTHPHCQQTNKQTEPWQL